MRADYGNQRPGFRFSHTPSVFDQHPRLASPTVAGDPLVRGDLADLVATITTFLPAFVVDREEVAQLVVQLAVHCNSNHQSGIHNDLAGVVVDSKQLIGRQLFTGLERIDLRVKKNFVRVSVPNS